ncbi:MAG: hypothetical protein JWQ81_5066 [Amycolatopsis sp.]|nr:hypothetical protein [Amycolatopsis sp.]
MLRMSIERGDVEWEARVRAAHHRLARTQVYLADGSVNAAWSAAHGAFRRALLDVCGNSVLLDSFDRMWTASQLARRWSGHRTLDRDYVDDHRRLEEAALARDADTAAELLADHVSITADALTRPDAR